MDAVDSSTARRKVMVVADPTRESAAALQYALLHSVVENDELILLHVESPNSWMNTLSTLFKRQSFGAGISFGSGNIFNSTASDANGVGGGEVDFLDEMRRTCEAAQPKILVQIEKVVMEENRDKASTILSQCALRGVNVLIIGQRRSLSTAILGLHKSLGASMSMTGTKVTDTAEYLIENSKCTCVAVQKKGQNAGYLLNTKTCRNFWLLA